MPAFEYTALDGSGNRRKDVLEADSSRQARQILRDQGLNPIDVKSASTGRKVSAESTFQFIHFVSGLILGKVLFQSN